MLKTLINSAAALMLTAGMAFAEDIVPVNPPIEPEPGKTCVTVDGINKILDKMATQNSIETTSQMLEGEYAKAFVSVIVFTYPENDYSSLPNPESDISVLLRAYPDKSLTLVIFSKGCATSFMVMDNDHASKVISVFSKIASGIAKRQENNTY
jgi:hypothetical protein